MKGHPSLLASRNATMTRTAKILCSELPEKQAALCIEVFPFQKWKKWRERRQRSAFNNASLQWRDRHNPPPQGARILRGANVLPRPNGAPRRASNPPGFGHAIHDAFQLDAREGLRRRRVRAQLGFQIDDGVRLASEFAGDSGGVEGHHVGALQA